MTTQLYKATEISERAANSRYALETLPSQDEWCVLRDPPAMIAPQPRIRMFANAVRPAPPRPGADLNAPLMQNTPNEREVTRLSRSGRQLSELEILQEKHEIEFRRVIPVVAQALKDVVSQHESLIRNGASRDERYAAYETNAVPAIRIDDYVQRIAEYTYISPATLISSLIVLERLATRHPTLLFSMLNVYKLFFVAVRIASKVVDLRTLNNKNFAPVGGISNRHLNDIEARMLIDLRFDLYISPAEFRAYVVRATEGVPQPIAISASFQRAMDQMALAQQQQQQQLLLHAHAASLAAPRDPLASSGLISAGNPSSPMRLQIAESLGLPSHKATTDAWQADLDAPHRPSDGSALAPAAAAAPLNL